MQQLPPLLGCSCDVTAACPHRPQLLYNSCFPSHMSLIQLSKVDFVSIVVYDNNFWTVVIEWFCIDYAGRPVILCCFVLVMQEGQWYCVVLHWLCREASGIVLLCTGYAGRPVVLCCFVLVMQGGPRYCVVLYTGYAGRPVVPLLLNCLFVVDTITRKRSIFFYGTAVIDVVILVAMMMIFVTIIVL